MLLECQSALELVEDGESRRQAGIDREVEQHPAGKRVQRADRRMIESVERRAGFGARIVFEAAAGSAAQLGGGLLGERDGGDAGDRYAGAYEADDSCNEGTRLAGAGARLDEQGRVEIGADADARCLIGR